MARQRTREYLDVVLKEGELTRLKKGFTVHRWQVGPSKICLAIKLTDRKTVKEIQKLKQKIRELQWKAGIGVGGWTEEARAKLSESMKKAHAKKPVWKGGEDDNKADKA
jgi:GTP cyclohydrolase III